MSYCKYIETISGEKQKLHKNYHDNHYGFPLHNDDELFGRLVLEINQAGLNWEIILKKEEAFRDSFDQFSIQKVAHYSEEDRQRLLSNPAIIRNKLKINAAIENARRIILLQQEFGSFDKWLALNHPKTLEEWTKLFKKTFLFTGGEIVNEFLMSIGYLPGSHDKECPIFKKIKNSNSQLGSNTNLTD
jgi:DNA-3-methyladenine glycosylase I